MSYTIVYITFGDIDNAREIARICVEQKLIACANIFPHIESVYYWQGEVKNDKEVSAFFKTTGDKVTRLIECIKENHTYSCPCIISLPIKSGDEGFLKWLSERCN